MECILSSKFVDARCVNFFPRGKREKKGAEGIVSWVCLCFLKTNEKKCVTLPKLQYFI